MNKNFSLTNNFLKNVWPVFHADLNHKLQRTVGGESRNWWSPGFWEGPRAELKWLNICHKKARERNGTTRALCILLSLLCAKHTTLGYSVTFFLYVLGYCCFHRFLKLSESHYFSSSTNCFVFTKREKNFFSFLVDFNFLFVNHFKLPELARISTESVHMPLTQIYIKILPLFYLICTVICAFSVCSYVYIYIYIHHIYTPVYIKWFFLSIFESKLHTCPCPPRYFLVYLPRIGVFSNIITVRLWTLVNWT